VSEGLVKDYVHDLRLALGDDPKRHGHRSTSPPSPSCPSSISRPIRSRSISPTG
jgi:hypothetical protein